MTKDEMNQYKWLDSEKVAPQGLTKGQAKAQQQMANQLLNFLNDD